MCHLTGSGERYSPTVRLTRRGRRAYARRKSAPSRTLLPTPNGSGPLASPQCTPGGRLPVTARLSKRFYDQLGEEIASELVDWFNSVDATYRTDLRELNELNFSRFDAKLEQRLAESDAKWERRIAELDAKWGSRWSQLDAKLEHRLAELRAELVKELADVKSGLNFFFNDTATT